MVMSKTKRIGICLILFLLLACSMAGVVLYRMHAEHMRKFAAAETCGQYREVASLLGEPIAIYHLDDETELWDINHKARAEIVGENQYAGALSFAFNTDRNVAIWLKRRIGSVLFWAEYSRTTGEVFRTGEIYL